VAVEMEDKLVELGKDGIQRVHRRKWGLVYLPFNFPATGGSNLSRLYLPYPTFSSLTRVS
jgi:hypothetical protein